jgi:hypothetical protein
LAEQQAEAQRVAETQRIDAERAEAQRVVAEQEVFAREEAERVALANAQALEAAAQRTQNEAIAARAEQARIAAERATAEREAAEQARIQAEAAAQEQARVQAEAVAQEQARIQAEAVAQEQARVQAEAAAAVTPEPEIFRGIGRNVDENLYVPEVQVPEQIYTPEPPAYSPAVESVEPLPVEAAPVAGIGSPVVAEPVYRGAVESVEPLPVEAGPIAGIGSPVVTEQVGAPYAAEPVYREQAGMPNAVIPADYNAPVGDMTDPMMGPEDYAITGPRPTVRPTPETVIQYSKPSATPSLDFVTSDGRQGYYFVTNAGKPAKTKANPTAFVSVDPNATYRLVNERGQNVVVTTGTGEQGLRDAYAAAQRLSVEGGTKADWYLEQSDSNGQWTRIADDDPKGSDLGVVGDIAGIALPIAAAILTAGASLPAQMAAAGLAGGVGGALAGDDPLKAALLNAATAGVMNASGANKAISGALNSALGPAATKATEEVVNKVGEEAFEQILVKGASQAVQAAANVAGNTLASETAKAVLGGTAGSQPPPTQPPVEEPPVSIVTGARPEAVTGANVVTGIGGGAAADAVAGDARADTLQDEEIVVTAPEVSAPPAPDVTAGIGGAIPGVENLINTPEIQEAVTAEAPRSNEEIVVTAPEAPPPAAPDVTAGIGGAIPGLIPGAGVYDPVEDVIINTATPETPVEQPIAAPAPPLVEEPPAIVVTGAKPDVVADAVAGIGGIVTPVEIPPSTVATEPPFEQPPVAEEEPPIAIVTGARPDAVADAVAGIGGSVITNVLTGQPPVDYEPGITVEAERPTVPEQEPSLPVNVLPPVDYEAGIDVTAQRPTTPEQEPIPPVSVLPPVDYEPGITVEAQRPTYPEPPAEEPIPLALPGLQTTPVSPPDLLKDVNPEVPEERSILDTALGITDIATTVLPIVGGIVGGGGGGGGGTLPPDTSGITFRPSPLRPRLPGGGIGGVGGAGGRYPYTPTTYGRTGGDQETEYLFFTRDPAAGAAAAPAIIPGKKEGGEIEDDMVKHLVEYHKNGGHHGPGQVKGIGSGQDDKIPAWLSDGEYVWSAQDVADLGDGSTDEGVRRLDKMRQMVRQQAGRKDVKKIAKPQKGIDKMLKAVGGLA